MRLVHTTQYYWPFIGGAEKYCQSISEGLASDHEIRLYTTDVISVSPLIRSIKREELKNGVKITRLCGLRGFAGMYGNKKLNSGSNSLFRVLSSMDTQFMWSQILLARTVSSSIPHKFFWLAKQLSDADFLVLFNIITGITSLSYSISRLKKKPFVIFPMFHVGLQTYETASLLRILRDATLAICSTAYEKQALIDRGVDPRKIRVVNEGVAEPSVKKAAINRVETLLDRQEKQLVLMYVGRRDPDKGYPHALSAVSWLFRAGIPLKLVLCGQGKIGDDLPDYVFLRGQKVIVDLGVADEQTKVAAMSLSDAVILPSRAETYPLVFVESWLLGKPVIGARIGSISSIVREGIDGLLVEYGDVKALVAAIKSLYDDPDKMAEMGKNGQIRAKKEFTFDKSVRKIRDIFQELSAGMRKND